MKIRFLGAHNRETKDSRLVSLLVDDVLALDAGSLSSSLSLEAQYKIKAVLLTHQHYDHIRGIPALAMNLFLGGAATTIYSIPEALTVLGNNLMNEVIYPDFRQKPPERPAISFSVIEPNRVQRILDYEVLAVPVRHSVPTVGYQLTSADGKSFFYAADTGPGLAECWEYVSPQLLVIEVTASNKYTEWMVGGGHLTPSLLSRELEDFRKLKGYLPRVVIVHMNPPLEKDIAAEVAKVAKALGASITLAREGMEINL
jgi:ribonuclease BN (tRNA processing enzyme)